MTRDTNYLQEIAPNYYDISSFPKGEIRSALIRVAERLSRKEKMRTDSSKKR
jgi:pre-mRNA-splicing factor ATP-dependent RNA helicase DHX15/PRP43